MEGKDADDLSRTDTCPSCQQRDGIRFLGSAIATLLSVSLSTLFGTPDLNADEKKALVFTDSVQDAAHRAGFVAARSHTLTMRSVMRDAFADSTGELTLPELATAILSRAGTDPFRRYRILPSEFTSDEKMRPFWEAEHPALVSRDVRDKVERRLLFDLAMEFGMASRLGRTLEATGSLGVHVNVGSPARMATLARAAIKNDDQATLDERELNLSDQVLVQWVRGVVEHMRTQGSIDHVWFERYLKKDGDRWMIWGGRPASQGMPAFPKGRSAPAFPRVGGKTWKDPLLDSVTDSRSWYARWTGRTLGLSPQHGARLVRALLDRLARDLVLSAVTTDSGGVAYGIPQAHVLVTPTTDADLAAKRHQLLCDTCHSHVTGSVEAVAQLAGAPCLYARCPGRLSGSAMEPGNFYRRLYASSDMRRIVSREHTSLLDTKVRLEYEEGFKRGQSDPASPNTLVATPTLELGIDIGDLSAVFLASLPRTVASYLQRIGRAGRLTGNALNLAYVTGRGESLPRLGDPSSLINGAVRPPSIYLSAEEILQRQYLAYLMDAFARDGVDAHHPRTARMALENTTPGSFLGDLIAYAEGGAGELLATFLESFGGHLRVEATESLRAWAMPGDEPRTSGLAAQAYAASTAWRAAKELLEHRQTAIAQSIPGLQQAAAVPAATEDDKRALQTAHAALKQVQARLGDIAGEYWIAALEEFGLLPNYTLLGDSATLDVSMSWYDPEQGTYESRPESISRATAQALREFAPGATFYAKGLQIEVDAVDLGTDADGIRTFAFCDECGFAVDVGETGATTVVTVCPRCGSDGIADMGQRVDVVELKRASAAIRRDEAMIDDRADERLRTTFTLVTAVDIDPAQVKNAWYVEGYDFGAKYVNRLTIRWLNVGKRMGTAAPLMIAGDEYQAPRFRVCEGCGHLDNSARANSMDEHRPWCVFRKSSDEHVRTIALSRTLVTQGVVLPLPWTVTTGDLFALPSLQAALLLGLRDQFGGSPDHIGVVEVRDPGIGGATTPALLLHDKVPGGTGYLADLANPADLWALLVRAYGTVHDCPCADEGRLACHRCLLPLAPPYLADRVSRLSAERHLRALLTSGTEGDVVADAGWRTTSVATKDPGNESHLELRFREAFRKLVAGLGATVKEEPGPWGNTILFTLGSLQWKLEPQALLDGVRPDFLLTSGKPGPRVAIFTDGFAFHATPAHNRIADDAAKREVLRQKGDVVLAVTSRDLDLFESGSVRSAPAWFRTDFLPLLTGMYGFSSHVATSALSGPMGMLAEWIQQLQREDFEKFARAVPLGLPHTLDLVVAERASLTEIARGLFEHPDSAGAGADQNAWWWRQGALGMLARRQRLDAGGPMLVDVAVVLDSRTTALVEPGFRTDWETWLELSNLLMFRTGEMVTTIGVLATDERPDVEVIYPMPRRVDLPERWLQVIRDVMNSDAEELAQELSLMGVPAPDWVGEEVGAELIPVDFAWTTAQIAVLLKPDERDVRDLEAEGWRIVAPEADAIASAIGSH
ncbi:MAG TPA: helicase-related protein [Propionibacteriaceae bacterium]|nr:helicase-related protein [Propionibacteriaceae bacterium]